MHRKSPLARAVCSLLILLTACQDLPTAVAPKAPSPSRASASAATPSPFTTFHCVGRRRDPASPNGWRARLHRLPVRATDAGRAGTSVQYRFRQQGADGTLLIVADCLVPSDAASLRRVDRYFGVMENGGAEQFAGRQEGSSIAGCVISTTGCVVDELIVIAEPRDESPDPCEVDPVSCYGPGGGSFGGGGIGGGGDGTSASGEEGPLLWVACVGAGITALGGGILTQTSLLQYYRALEEYNEARLRYSNAVTVPDRMEYYDAMRDAEADVNILTWQIAGAATVVAGGVAVAAAACSPLFVVPTP